MTSILIEDGYIYCANVGDSKAVLLRESKNKEDLASKQQTNYNNNNNEIIELTVDHKPNDFKEKERIEKTNGEVRPSYNKSTNTYKGV